MPAVGTKPKPEGQAVHRNKPVIDWIEVPDVPFTGGPRLPYKRANGQTWHPFTRRWWGVVSKMPHCVLWGEEDWELALETAEIKDAFNNGGLSYAAEIRLREKLMGTTLDSKRDLRIKLVPVSPAVALAVARIDDYRAL